MVKVAVIGAGASGLTATKTCLEYDYEVVCYEKTCDVGGLWRYKPYECDGEASVMKSTVINTSKEMGAFSDFPPPPEYANYMHNRQMMQYFRSYADHFNVVPHIRFNTVVDLVERADDYDSTGRWKVKTQNIKNGDRSVEIFDAVMLCSGHHVNPYMPHIKGLKEKFRGRVLHSHSYKNDKEFEDKNVIVVGIGNSGGDITVELSRVANKVYLVTRRGSWIWNRVFDEGLPMDMHLNSHLYSMFLAIAPRLTQAYEENKLMRRFNLETYGLKPAHHLFQQHPTLNDELPCRIVNGTVTVKPNIAEFTDYSSCLFEDGTRADDVDAVVLCTGYEFGFPYLEPGIIPVTANRVKLFRNMYVPKLKHPETLAVIGLIQPVGAIMPISEMQSRVVCEYLSTRRGQLPSHEQMEQAIHETEEMNSKIYVESRRHTIQVFYILFMNQLASMIGVTPHPFWTYLFQGDFRLAWALLVGPCLPYQYRLRGPHKWAGARDAIVHVWDRVYAATKTRSAPRHVCDMGVLCTLMTYMKGILVFLVVLLVVVWFTK